MAITAAGGAFLGIGLGVILLVFSICFIYNIVQGPIQVTHKRSGAAWHGLDDEIELVVATSAVYPSAVLCRASPV